MFCSPFDEAVAHRGPAAIFLLDRKGMWRFAPRWTRDCWGRAPGPHAHGWTWLLARDRGSASVQLVLCTSPTLLTEHPRLDLRAFPSESEARAALAALGSPPLAVEAW